MAWKWKKDRAGDHVARHEVGVSFWDGAEPIAYEFGRLVIRVRGSTTYRVQIWFADSHADYHAELDQHFEGTLEDAKAFAEAQYLLIC